jgi:biopolymer transport protein TolR
VGVSLGRGGHGRPLSEINVTPFVDVMLVLLIIFMIAAPMMMQGIDVDLPETTTQPIRAQDEPLILSVKKDGAIFLGRQAIAPGELQAKLQAVFDSREDRELYLRADKDAPYGAVAKAMGAARTAGAKKLGIVTEPETTP